MAMRNERNEDASGPHGMYVSICIDCNSNRQVPFQDNGRYRNANAMKVILDLHDDRIDT